MEDVASSAAVAAPACGEEETKGAGLVDLDVDVAIDVEDPDPTALVFDLALSPASLVV